MRRAALTCAVLGIGFLVPFDAWWTLTLGVVLLFTAIALGVLAIATPEFMDRD